MTDTLADYIEFSMSDLGASIDALAVTLANLARDGKDISDDTFEAAGTELFRAGKAEDVTGAYTALLKVTRGLYEAEAMTPAARMRVDEVAHMLNRI